MNYEEIYGAYVDCRKNKTTKRSFVDYRTHAFFDLKLLVDEINENRYRCGISEVFHIEYPKVREVWAASFRDRIVHHLLYNHYSKGLMSGWITDTYACIPDRGTLYGQNRIARMLRKSTNGWDHRREVFYVKCDVKNFFNSIDKNILWSLLSRLCPTNDVYRTLLHTVVHHDCRENYKISSNYCSGLIPYHKSLFNNPPNKGLPIGNLTSQLFSNVYNNELDQYVKHVLRIPYYGRYVDDFILIHKDVGQLQQWVGQIAEFLWCRLALELHPNKTQYGSVWNGVDFIGSVLYPYDSRQIRGTTYQRFELAVQSLERLVRHSVHSDDSVVCRINSYLGMMKHTDTMQTAVARLAKIDYDGSGYRLVIDGRGVRINTT